MLSTTLIFALGASACDVSRTDSTHVDARLLCELRARVWSVGVWVGSAALKIKVRILEIYVFAA